jgi:hypothetical protein
VRIVRTLILFGFCITLSIIFNRVVTHILESESKFLSNINLIAESKFSFVFVVFVLTTTGGVDDDDNDDIIIIIIMLSRYLLEI